MGSGEKSPRSLIHFNRHLLHHHHHHAKNNNNNNKQLVRDVNNNVPIPKGCMAIKVGQGEEELQRFVVPVIYLNHPLFMQLLKEAEEEYGFDQKGTITIPCHVEEFRNIRGLIDREKSFNHNHHHHNNHHHHHHVRCFGF